MENDIALMTSGYLLTRLGIVAIFGYLIYRFARPTPSKQRIHSQNHSARARSQAERLGR